MLVFVAITILGVVTGAYSGCVSEGSLQQELSFDKIEGEWCQAYYSADSIYSQAACWESRIFGYNQEAQEFNMENTLDQIEGAKRKPKRHVILSTANFGDSGIPGEVNVKNHLATDYTTYLLFYQCQNGNPIVSVDLRKGITRLPLNKMREISEILERVGIDFFSMAERSQLGCKLKK